MANYLSIFSAPDKHINFIEQQPSVLFSYIDGRVPDIVSPKQKQPTLWQRITRKNLVLESSSLLAVPADWPAAEIELEVGEVNHRNTELYHFLLNGTSDCVVGSGSLFQTWFETPATHIHSAIDFELEGFAFRSKQVPELVEILSLIDFSTAKSRYKQWLEEKGELYDVADEDVDELVEELGRFLTIARAAMDENWGLIWIAT